MPLHPIIALDHIIEEYKDHLLTEFHAKDPKLLEELEREVNRDLFLAQEPFYQAHRPFRPGARWAELPIDPRLAAVMETRTRKHGSPASQYAYSHQSAAISELLRPDARPVVVTTGTGSGKTEAFLLPVIQNAIEDAARFAKSGLTAILVYPLNALGSDQHDRIRDYLQEAGFAGSVRIAQYNRGTKQADRDDLRRNPPHILLTNYMMLEYLLVRPADREAIFANHRCRFLVLDEVHTYRGSLGSNIALLVRRLRAHLQLAKHDWLPSPSEADRARRFPSMISVGTSATIKSIAGEEVPPDEARRLRDEAVQEFFSKLTGAEREAIQVFGEEIQDLAIPADATHAQRVAGPLHVDHGDPESVRTALCILAGVPEDTPLPEAARRCRLLWDINRWLVAAPMPVSQMVERVRGEVATRNGVAADVVRNEVEAALVAGAALPDGIPGALRLRAHRFIRGGWCFHRCLNPECGRLYPMGQPECECGYRTAPLHLCRNCGADYLQFVGDPAEGTLRPSIGLPQDGEQEWMLFEPGKFEASEVVADDEDDESEDEDGTGEGTHGQGHRTGTTSRNALVGSFDPKTLAFSSNPEDYPLKAALVRGRRLCHLCGGRAGSRSVITPVSLGTSAALKVLAEGTVDALDEANRGDPNYDGKSRLLIFSDSRQDAAHQARFIVFASRYDRMRRNLVRILQGNGELSFQRAVELLGQAGIENRDNPYAPSDPRAWPSVEQRERIRAWEEAPLLDDVSVSAGYRATIVRLGLVGVVYEEIEEYVAARGELLAKSLEISVPQLVHLCRCFLDTALHLGALSREMLRYHPRHGSYPRYMSAAQWERSMVWPKGLPADTAGNPIARLEEHDVPRGIKLRNVWRNEGRGSGPAFEKGIRHVISRFGGRTDLTADDAIELMSLLCKGSYLMPISLGGVRDSRALLQVNEERLSLCLLTEQNRRRCGVCGLPKAGGPVGAPCPRCHGQLVVWKDGEVDRLRTVKRIRAERALPLNAGEHTAQIPTETRLELESDFKAPLSEAKTNLLACSPTLEMGIDVGGLDAVAMRNIPPRPDNYAQRGGRAGRRARVGLVLGYARRTPHDQYFFDKPAEMIAGEIPAPALALANRDVILRHIFAIAFGAAEPGLAGRMVEYVSADGVIQEETVQALIDGVTAQTEYAIGMAKLAFSDEVLRAAKLSEDALHQVLARLPDRIRDILERTSRQVIELRQALAHYYQTLQRREQGTRSADLVARLLGIRTERQRGATEQADDRSAGYPLRRFAEAGLLPGYEFPTEPAAVRLLGDPHEEDSIAVARHFGIAQFQPGAPIYARAKRWRACGLDLSSPWNPRADSPGLTYRICRNCELRHDAQRPTCPRCGDEQMNKTHPAFAFGGFLAKPDERPVLTEEDRIPGRNTVSLYPQWDGEVTGRWALESGWQLNLYRRERVLWLNEGHPPTEADVKQKVPRLHQDASGFLLCPACGSVLKVPAAQSGAKGRQRAQKGGDDQFGHRRGCPMIGQPPVPMAIYTEGTTEVLRLVIPVPTDMLSGQHKGWGLSLGSALRIGMRQLYMLDGSEIEFELEGPWDERVDERAIRYVALSFIDPSIGGTGYLGRAASEFDQVARRAVDHLDHEGCESACYRCLKSYANQRFHELLQWPLAITALEALSQETPLPQPLELGDTRDPKSWLEAYAAGVGSPLELKFLRLFDQHGFTPEKQFPIGVPDGSSPITVADFAVPERRLAIYIDGASVHLGHVARRDRLIRQRLRSATPPWHVVELRAADLGRVGELVTHLR